jgi:N-acetylmuramoyl-L-alanine amidase
MLPIHRAPHSRRKDDKALLASLRRGLPKSRPFLVSLLLLALAALFWPARQLRSDNFVFYLPSTRALLPSETIEGIKYLPILPILNTVGKVGGLQEKKNSLRIWFGTVQVELRPGETRVRLEKNIINLAQPVRVSNGQWMVPVDFLISVLPRLTHQTVEYQEGTNRIFIGDVKPSSFTVRMDPLPNGVRLTVQFTDKVTVRTASSNGKWVLFLGDRPIEPLENAYHFQNPYVNSLEFDDQDGVTKLILSPTSAGLNFYPVQAEGGKVLLADVLKPPPAAAQGPPPQAARSPAAPETASTSPASPITELPAAPPGPPLPVVVLDAGHGGTETGGRSRDGLLEKDLVAQYVARVRLALLATNKYRIVLTRTGDVATSLEQRALAANLAGAHYFLSFHAGDLGTASRRITVFSFQSPTPPVPSPAPPPSALVPWAQVQEAHLEQSRQLALALQQSLSLLNGVEVDLPATAPVRALRSVDAPAVAIELGRLAADTDSTALTDPAFQQQVAASVVHALASLEKGGT